MPFRIHALMQHTYNLDESRFERAVKYDMLRIAHHSLSALLAAVADVEAAQADSRQRATA